MRLTSPITALRSALTDPARCDRNVALALVAYAALWTVYGAITKTSQGLHPDMTELIAWSRDLAWGYKHPPFAAALVWLWFKLFPVAGWSYYLLAMLMPATALWIVWRLSAEYLDIEMRVFGLALLTLVPFFNFHALKYNVNTVLMPLWAATAFWFLRSYRTRSAFYAALAGAGAAASMLGKYWSVFLIAGLVLAALIDKRRGAYFRSPAPWITVIAGLVVLGPHLAWLYAHHFAPFAYALGVHGEKPIAAAALSALGYLAGVAGYAAIPVVIVLIMARPDRATLTDIVWPADANRRLAASAFWGPLLLPALAALASGTEITSLWSMPAYALLPVLLLSPAAVSVRDIDTRRVLGLTAAISLIMPIASPLVAVIAQRNGPPPASAQAALLAAEVERLWHQTTPLPLRFVGGEADLADGIITYAQDRPRALTDMPAPDPGELARAGKVIVCFAEDAGCRARAGTQGIHFDAGIARNFLRFPGKLQHYAILIVPPRR